MPRRSEQASITDATKAIATSQVALPKATCDAVYATTGTRRPCRPWPRSASTANNVFGDDDGASQLGTVTGSASSGYAVSLTVPVDTRTTPGGCQAPGGSQPGGAPPSGQAPGGTPPSGAPPLN